MKRTERTGLKLVSVYIIAFFYSASMALVGQMLVPLKEYYNISIQQANMLLSVQSFGGLAIAIISILFIDSMNQRKLVVAAGVLLAVSLMFMAILPPILLISLMFIVSGLAAGTVNVLSNSVTMGVAVSHHQRYLTIMHLSISTGAFVTPMIAQSIFDTAGLTGTFLIIGAAMLLCSALGIGAYSVEMRQGLKSGSLDIRHRLSEVAKVVRIPGITAAILLSLMATIWQICIMYNVSGAITARSDMNTGAIALSLFSLGMIVSRMIYTPLAGRFSEGRVLAVMNGIGAVVWAGAMLAPGTELKIVLITAAALFCGINYPIIFGAACRLAHQNTAAASGFVVLAFYAGIIVFCPIVGRLCDQIGYDMGLLTLVVPLVLMIPLGLVLHKRMKEVL